MLKIDPKNTPIPKLHGLMLGAIAPRPIAFASTVDKDGHPNLAPFSFFNAFGAHPPTLIFSPARRATDMTTKHTYQNVKQVPEVVINVVTYDMVHQTSLASTEYPKNVSEFEKAGFTPLPSEMVKPFRVKESPVQLECKVVNVIQTGDQGGAGNLIICEILLMHINELILDKNGRIDQNKIDLVARMGGNYYCRASGNAIFEIEKPTEKLGIGIDQIPETIRLSKILTGNDLGKLGNVEALPTEQEIEAARQQPEIKAILDQYANDKAALQKHLHTYARKLLEEGKVMKAWETLSIEH